MSWRQLDPALRAELDALLAAPTDAYLSDFNEALAWWLAVFLGCLLGAGVSIWSLGTEVATGDFLAALTADPVGMLSRMPSLIGLPVALLVGIWVVSTCVRNIGRRGFAALSTAIVVVRGPKLRVLPYDDIASATQEVIGERGKSFTLLTLELKNGTKEKLNVHGLWAKEVISRI